MQLPPAWSGVHVAREEGTKLQAVGKDKAGRWQYRYHPALRDARVARIVRQLLRYVCPAVIHGFSRGRVIESWLGDVSELGRQRGLHRSEKALLSLLAASS